MGKMGIDKCDITAIDFITNASICLKGPRLRMTPASAKYWSTSGPSDAPVKTSTWKSSFSLSLQVQEVQPLHRQHV